MDKCTKFGIASNSDKCHFNQWETRTYAEWMIPSRRDIKEAKDRQIFWMIRRNIHMSTTTTLITQLIYG